MSNCIVWTCNIPGSTRSTSPATTLAVGTAAVSAIKELSALAPAVASSTMRERSGISAASVRRSAAAWVCCVISTVDAHWCPLCCSCLRICRSRTPLLYATTQRKERTA